MFPLPKDPGFIKEVVKSWVEDVEDRLELGDIEGATLSLNTARSIYLSLPPGNGCDHLEKSIVTAGVNIEQHLQKPYANIN